MRRHLTLALALLTALAVVSMEPREASAQTASVTVRVILASNSGGGVDGSLSGISGQLTSRFRQYSSFRQLAVHSVSLSSGSARSVSLPNGQSMTVRFDGMAGSSYRIGVSLPGGGTTVTSPRGGLFFLAGPPYSGGILVVAVST